MYQSPPMTAIYAAQCECTRLQLFCILQILYGVASGLFQEGRNLIQCKLVALDDITQVQSLAEEVISLKIHFPISEEWTHQLGATSHEEKSMTGCMLLLWWRHLSMRSLNVFISPSTYICEEVASEDQQKVASSTHFLLLHFGRHHEQLSRRVLHFKIFKDRRCVVRHRAFAPGVHHQFAKTIRAYETNPHK